MNRRDFLKSSFAAVAAVGVGSIAGCALPDSVKGKRESTSTDKASAKLKQFAYCGVNCNDCDVFKATVHGDAEALQRAHKRWTKTAQEHWGMQTLDLTILKCRGCRTEGADIFKGCRHCPVRRCAKSRNLPSCGLCQEWKTCKQLSDVLANEPAARANLERIKVSSVR